MLEEDAVAKIMPLTWMRLADGAHVEVRYSEAGTVKGRRLGGTWSGGAEWSMFDILSVVI